ncbi:hypothetical protein FM104_00365 [Microbacterium esteraromaticum]|uniref:Uncharacterized protein n=1 Tax=Microbacterium esteraromaticum TaxID=57043 RepID=A0A1R4I6U9_9MICO|nr:hypothetical protein [Microbacterium esteraromaticum]SJN15550.1 hypothetical protein FM104_00365 [Microbacterium esteraromaticum]
MDPATTDDRRRRRLLIATIAGGLVLLLLVGVGIYGLLRGPAPQTDTTPTDPSPAATSPLTNARRDGPASVPRGGGPEAFARAVAEALFTWDTATGYAPSEYAQVLADVAAGEEAEALAGDVRSYLPAAQAWAQLRQYQTRQWLTIDAAVIPESWETAVSQAAPGQIPEGAVAYTISGTRHRDGTWDTEPVEASRPVAFTVFIVCTPPVPVRGAGLCELLRLSQLDNPLH